MKKFGGWLWGAVVIIFIGLFMILNPRVSNKEAKEIMKEVAKGEKKAKEVLDQVEENTDKVKEQIDEIKKRDDKISERIKDREKTAEELRKEKKDIQSKLKKLLVFLLICLIVPWGAVAAAPADDQLQVPSVEKLQQLTQEELIQRYRELAQLTIQLSNNADQWEELYNQAEADNRQLQTDNRALQDKIDLLLNQIDTLKATVNSLRQLLKIEQDLNGQLLKQANSGGLGFFTGINYVPMDPLKSGIILGASYDF